jgi:glutamyl-tRNA reductase
MQRLTGDILSVSLARPSASAALRARVPAGAEERRRMLDGLSDLAGDRLLLHTCERFEVYAASAIAEPDRWIGRLSAWLDVEAAALRPYVELRHGDEAARRLLRVAAGLESRLVGEPQIHGQVRKAFREAQDARALGPLLDALARAAIHTGRRVRSETSLGRRAGSVVGLALDRLQDALGSLRERRVIVAGTGSLAAEMVAALNGSGAKVAITSRVPARAHALAARFGAESLDRDELAREMLRADGLVACTYGSVAIECVSGRRFAVVDLGMPPNVDPRVSALPGVRLWGLDDLKTSVGAPDVLRAGAIVEEELVRYRRWRAGRALHLEIERLKAEAAA